MKAYSNNIEQLSLDNLNFRQVVYTPKNLQLVLMNLNPLEDIGLEVHHDSDQFFRFESGQGKVIVEGVEYVVSDGFVVIVPAGLEHNVINTSNTEKLKFYTIYTPPHHKDGTVHVSKEVALNDEEHFDGEVTQ